MIKKAQFHAPQVGGDDERLLWDGAFGPKANAMNI
jgi:hypothetical protein